MTHLVLGTFTPSVLLAVSRRAGHLEEHGLDVIEQTVTSSPAQFQSLLDGGLDLAFTSPDNVLGYRFDPGNPLATTADARIVSAIDRGMGLAMYARVGIDHADKLRGATFAVDVPTSGFALALYRLAEALGLSRGEYEVVPIGSTPRRLQALLEGRCDATMLNAGNELPAEDAGCTQLARTTEVCGPYLGTVLAVVGESHMEQARSLASALRQTARGIASGELADHASAEARTLLGLSEQQGARYVDRLLSPTEGLVLEDAIPLEPLRTIVELRRHYLPIGGADPSAVDGQGTDPLISALEPGSGLFATPVSG